MGDRETGGTLDWKSRAATPRIVLSKSGSAGLCRVARSRSIFGTRSSARFDASLRSPTKPDFERALRHATHVLDRGRVARAKTSAEDQRRPSREGASLGERRRIVRRSRTWRHLSAGLLPLSLLGGAPSPRKRSRFPPGSDQDSRERCPFRRKSDEGRPLGRPSVATLDPDRHPFLPRCRPSLEWRFLSVCAAFISRTWRSILSITMSIDVYMFSDSSRAA